MRESRRLLQGEREMNVKKQTLHLKNTIRPKENTKSQQEQLIELNSTSI